MISFSNIFSEIKLVFLQGGPVLWVMVALSVILYGLIISTWMGLYQVKQEIHGLDETKFISQDEKSIECDVAIFKLDHFAWVQRRLPMIAVLVASAPLAGLLGTVFGMFVTFNGLASQAAARPIDSISLGISSAMITTQAGLFMAIPGAILLAILRSQVSGVEGSLEQKMYHHMVTMKGVRL
ncbi:MAG: biopolymer transport protein ExbB [Rubritalea sp.]|jgi:biopolymer transport protein ExbB|tara:strand:- start:258 stop:803 length:546 start_codon:yes stop_codon:yes gene_type:complete